MAVAANGTAAVTLTGPLDAVKQFLVLGFTFKPDAHYSGDAPVVLTVIDLQSTDSGSGAFVVRVTPDASPVALDWAATGEVRLATGPFVFPRGFLSVSGWPDGDGSETLHVFLSLDVADPAEAARFGLAAAGVALTPLAPGLWQLEGTGAASFQALLDTLVLTPPSDFSGRVFVHAFGDLLDSATYSDLTALTDRQPVFAGVVDLRFFEPAVFTTPTVVAQ